jgi:hypothetical protein
VLITKWLGGGNVVSVDFAGDRSAVESTLVERSGKC